MIGRRVDSVEADLARIQATESELTDEGRRLRDELADEGERLIHDRLDAKRDRRHLLPPAQDGPLSV